MSYSTGEKCYRAGVYTCPLCRQTINMDVGDTFPPCPKCEKGVDWIG